MRTIWPGGMGAVFSVREIRPPVASSGRSVTTPWLATWSPFGSDTHTVAPAVSENSKRPPAGTSIDCTKVGALSPCGPSQVKATRY